MPEADIERNALSTALSTALLAFDAGRMCIEI